MRITFIHPQFLWLLLLIPLTIGLALAGRRGYSRLRFWLGLGLRGLLLALIVLALAGIQVHLPTNTLTNVFVLDVSDSVSPQEQTRGDAWLREAIAKMPRGDRAAVVLFGEDALVERLASEQRGLPELASTPITTRTDIASALQLALALFPAEGAGRIVLLSDGRENLDSALRQAELAASLGIQLQYVALGEQSQANEVLVDALEAPAHAREGQDFDLNVTIQSSAATAAALRVFADDRLIDTRDLELSPGATHLALPIKDAPSGFHRYRVQIVPDADKTLQNNEASAFTYVSGPPRVLVVEGSAGEADNLAAALRAAQMNVAVVAPSALPVTPADLAAWDAVALVNVPATALPGGALEALPVYIRDLGKGLLMVGGANTFGAGGYLRSSLEKALPVDMDVQSKERTANLALVLSVDKSGSMGRCHCDNPDLNQTYTRMEVGQPKVDIAKEAIMRSASALSAQDYLGVVAFDTRSHWALEMSPLVDALRLESEIGAIVAEGQTNLESGLLAAYDALKDAPASRKHIILMTDGWVHTGDLTPLVRQMRDQGITLSIVAAGEGSAVYLKALAEAGGGRYYPATDMLNVPDIFLKETVKSAGQYVIEEPFYPLPAGFAGPILKGVDDASLPALLGYNGTTAKNTARIDLLTPRGDPLLASWQYGLGKAAVWTSDFKGQWAKDWLSWESFPRFAAQLVGWVLPQPQTAGLNATVTLEDAGARIQLEALNTSGDPFNSLKVTARVVGPGLETREAQLSQVGAGRYETIEKLDQPGTYLVQMSAQQGMVPVGQVTAGLVVPYSPEYRAGSVNMGLLEALARAAGGSAITNPALAFLHNLPAAAGAQEIWRMLLIITALLFPVDVAVRRLVISQTDLRRARAWVSQRLPWRRGAQTGESPRALGQLFTARERARQRQERRAAPPPADQPAAPQTPPPSEPDSPAGEENTLARLREAARRAREQDAKRGK